MTIKALLDFIGKAESGGDYEIVWRGIAPKNRPKKLTAMTVGEVLAWQKLMRKIGAISTAAGKYQIIYATLLGGYKIAEVSLDDPFSPETQDKLATMLLNRRGMGKYIAGLMSTEDFANNLAKEWASLPVVTGPTKGMSYYGSDGLNKSLVSVDAFLAAVRSVRDRE